MFSVHGVGQPPSIPVRRGLDCSCRLGMIKEPEPTLIVLRLPTDGFLGPAARLPLLKASPTRSGPTILQGSRLAISIRMTNLMSGLSMAILRQETFCPRGPWMFHFLPLLQVGHGP